jgi:hypothetical protein
MKRIAVWAFYGVGALAIGYLALFAYAMFTGRDLQPGDPIHIFRKPDAPIHAGLRHSGVIARSESDEAIQTLRGSWIASLRSQ